jgi:hypothetical protein
MDAWNEFPDVVVCDEEIVLDVVFCETVEVRFVLAE